MRTSFAVLCHCWPFFTGLGQYTIQPGKSYSETLHTDPISGGIAIKITTVENGLFNGSPQTIFAYTLTNGQVWYDLSDVFGDPFAGKSLNVILSDTSCHAVWSNGIPPAGSQVNVCQPNTNLNLKLC
ncbi:conserved hypothetical protein [Talaromyces stipitatus ATCC 10500]|uniref:BYS1 domain protein n=1 Tax=Talaromyces stipitatus (strain ATCC 10500 / CBS 375.48 / QM 6759 / NRRL 1006) TaxID=441959 RepID=B8MPD6_TALSN|nr:uncharacterized protein TSTA_105860 [Talaromyces stipitatus ATCC 10500]EED14375.1 conserved hypothetical protein [Talaromyces stipitatus ATCC 10500]